MSRILLVLIVLIGTAGAVVAYGDPKRISDAGDAVSTMLRKRVAAASANHAHGRVVAIPRGTGGEFAVRAKVNGVNAPMVIDTGATSVVLTFETAKAAGLPLEILNFDVDLETVGGRTRAAKLSLDSISIGKLVERSVPALVVPRGQMKTNLLGMSFLDRLESWEVRSDQLRLRGYP
ncbi:TIGR02281 family clan AA aspartic protease [Rhodopseudomonas sp. HC1]|uniref:TIGR02281 family clan AA aspartic protease n=1 Tax=Rhodopseudomonas infernalis TaxID=2897386 RepID=UPI001EE9588D|nr:TIGR02281 family clan AA aspartic protease [Rhodopseudomonas infernalis]MCG6203069.1 TIGR02281 family clan AA aspartic protease [Rhodopseudomonas infernalis]